MINFQILPYQLFEQYKAQLTVALENVYALESTVTFTPDVFGFYSSIASVFSSKIEGENIELDSYLKHKFFKTKYLPDYTRRTDDLFSAYSFAKDNPLNFENVLQTHKLLSKHLLAASHRGRVRTQVELILNQEGNIEYVCAPPNIVKEETNKFFNDIQLLLNQTLTIEEVFFYAALIHLVFVKIHPFADGNGRTSRLLEKWFLAEKIGEKAWLIPSEKYYYEQLSAYYKNVHIGFEYESIDYKRAIPFLLMLPNAVFKNDES